LISDYTYIHTNTKDTQPKINKHTQQ